MAYFDCIIGSAGSSGIPLIVTCASDFAGSTITCTDGSTTLTDICPSSSPYELTFILPNPGTWTIRGTVSSTTYTESILIQPFEVEMITNVDISVNFYSAANDTVSYIGVDNQTHTITTDSSGHASATITINGRGSSLTFTSGVAKDPNNLSNYYSKQIALSDNTENIYLMPDGDIVYWYGYTDYTFYGYGFLQDIGSNGVTITPTMNTNDIYIGGTYSGDYKRTSLASQTQVDITNYNSFKIIGQHTEYLGYAVLTTALSSSNSYLSSTGYSSSTDDFLMELDISSDSGNYYPMYGILHHTFSATMKAMWLE